VAWHPRAKASNLVGGKQVQTAARARWESDRGIGGPTPCPRWPNQRKVASCESSVASARSPKVFRLRSALVSRPRRSTDLRSPGDAPPVGKNGGRGGWAGQETVPEPAWRRQPQVAAMGQSDPLPRTPHGQGGVRRQRFGVDPPELGKAGDDRSFLAWGLRHQPLRFAGRFGSWLQGPGANLRWGRGAEAVEGVLRDE